MTTRALPGFIFIYRSHHRETRSLAPLGHAIAQFMQTAPAAFIDPRSPQADHELARVLRAARDSRAAPMQFRSARFEP